MQRVFPIVLMCVDVNAILRSWTLLAASSGAYAPAVHIHVGVLCCFALFVCLTLLASFFLPSHLSFKNMYQQTDAVYLQLNQC